MSSHLFSDVYLVSDNLQTTSVDKVTSVEHQLGITFPPGYADYVTTLGAGDYCGYLRVYMPEDIQKNLAEFRQRWTEYYFWDKGHDVLDKQTVLESIIFADTIDGDEFIFHPSRPDKLYTLPRHDDMIYEVGSNLDELVVWVFETSKWLLPVRFRVFYSWKDRSKSNFTRRGSDLAFADLNQRLLSLALHTHAETDDSHERSLRIFVKTIGGYVGCYQYEAKSMADGIAMWTATIDCDADKRTSAAVQRIADTLQSLGFTPSAF